MNRLCLKLLSFLLPIMVHSQECNLNLKNPPEISSGNLASLATTVSVVFKDKTYNSLHYLIQVAGNDEIDDKSIVITQKETQEVLRYMYQDKLTYDDLVKMRNDLPNNIYFKRLNELQQIDAQRVLEDIIHVETRMNEYRNMSNMYCRFALTDNPYDEFPRESIFRKSFNFETTKEEKEKIIKLREGRGVSGLCWNKKN